MDANFLIHVNAQLGEGALWCELNKKLYWVDIEGRTFNMFDPIISENKVFPTHKRVGTVVPIDNSNVLLALEDGIATLNLHNGTIQYQIETNIHQDYNRRFNDGKCDPKGRFWVGTLSMDGVREVSSLYCIDRDFVVEEKINGVSISNGIVWSVDELFMYYIDTPTNQIVQYDFDSHSGNITNKKVVIDVPADMGSPDGMTMDEEGMLWVALWDGFGVIRCNPVTGKILQKVNVPAPKVTSCAFGGENLGVLYITTASVEMSNEELEKHPLSGAIFAVDVNVRGLPAKHFAL
ncbi:SMP-30/gluconolactonase/LRE family protein [Mucilaginibacter sp. X4EP1]|uniref:SMP-30/gluconolactonase/LRE family protein n=1 Tax=Mucilaginibacter sp. X4EP1 TaxID=2723092 RepID=UPI00216935D7|nr:SMP-30/gluconolactonase/LRE family protein [Mucilaginibacter sp. X4EP1]MCS3812975.1 sugar lactone lactonase YvrE [Mucilaginibacter sp. X4EP1]